MDIKWYIEMEKMVVARRAKVENADGSSAKSKIGAPRNSKINEKFFLIVHGVFKIILGR